MNNELTNIIKEMVRNACSDIGYPYNESCYDQVLNDLEHNHEIVLTNETRITYQLMNEITECVEQFATETEFNCSEEIIEHYENNK